MIRDFWTHVDGKNFVWLNRRNKNLIFLLFLPIKRKLTFVHTRALCSSIHTVCWRWFIPIKYFISLVFLDLYCRKIVRVMNAIEFCEIQSLSKYLLSHTWGTFLFWPFLPMKSKPTFVQILLRVFPFVRYVKN